MRFRSLSFVIPIVMVVFVVSILSVSSMIITKTVGDYLVTEAFEKNMVISEMVSKKITIYLDNAVDIVRTSAHIINEASPLNEELIKDEVNRIYHNNRYYDLVFYLNPEGRLIYSVPVSKSAQTDFIYLDRDYFQYVKAYQESFVSALYKSRVLDIPHFVIAMPLFDEDSKFGGVFAAGVPLENIYNVAQDTKKPFNGGLRIVDHLGALMVDPDLHVSDDIVLVNDFAIRMNGKESSLYEVLEQKSEGIGIIQKGETVCYEAITYISSTGWMIMMEQTENTILQDVYLITRRLRIITLLTIIGGMAVGLVLASQITVPLKKLSGLVERIGNGEPVNWDFDDRYNNEIGDLYLAFQDMSGRLDEKVKQLQSAYIRENQLQRYLNSILMSAAYGILAVDHLKAVTMLNLALEKITGYDKAEFIGKHLEVLDDLLGIDLTHIMEQILKDGKKVTDFEQPVRKKNGESIRCMMNASAVRGEDDILLGAVFMFKDVELERIIEERLRQEDRLNIMGRITSSIIHEIGNPLAGLANLLEVYEDIPGRAEKREIILLIQKEIDDLNQIVANYLHFAGQSPPVYTMVDINELLDEIVGIFSAEMRKNQIQLHQIYETRHLALKLDRRGIKQVIINILSNSIRAIGQSGTISIEVYEREGFVEVAFKDTGVGIREQDINRIFDLFYTTKEHGNGLGLYIAYKIITEHGGTITVSSVRGKGSCFVISLPVQAAEGRHENTCN